MTAYALFRSSLLALVLLLPGCFSSAEKVEHFYLLNGPNTIKQKQGGPRVLVADFTAETGYETARLAYRMSDHELRYYVYHKWTADPGRVLSEATASYLRASGLFGDVGMADRMQAPEAILSGVVTAIEELDRGDQWKARLAMRLLLRDARSSVVLLRHQFDVSVDCKERHPREVARGISQILASQIKKLAPRIAQAITGSDAAGPGPASESVAPPPPDTGPVPGTEGS
jgi:ABC-type uncharacterized transport system auxiliary subunit